MTSAVMFPSAFSPKDLFLYHVSRPEPRAKWVFNVSKHTNVVNSSPPPEAITSTVDKKMPNLGGLVWLCAVMGKMHCCLQKGLKNKAVTPVPTQVLDGWLNGQTGFWWIGALKEGHRVLWDSHVVMNWAMVFIPSSPQVAARNNIEVWHDKCLPGSLRVARLGELARKILDIVADDQDKEPEQVVHTHLCVLLAEGDDLELTRPKRVQTATPIAGDSPMKAITDYHSKGTGAEAIAIRSAPELEEAVEKLAKYRERIILLKEDRRAKKALLDQLQSEFEEKVSTYSAENEQLRIDRDDIQERAKSLWDEVENLRRKIESSESENAMLKDEKEALKKIVDRLRRERNSARSDAMKWLEENHLSSARPRESGNANGGDADGGAFSKTPSKSKGDMPPLRTRSASSIGSGLGHEGPVDQNAAATITKLKSLVTRLRRERDNAGIQASNWLRAEKEKLKNAPAPATTTASPTTDTGGAFGGGGSANGSSGSPIVAGLKAEGLQLKEERQAAKVEAEKLRKRISSERRAASLSSGFEIANGGRGSEDAAVAADVTDADSQEARQALGRLLDQTLDLQGTQAAPDSAAIAANQTNPEGEKGAATVPPSVAPAKAANGR